MSTAVLVHGFVGAGKTTLSKQVAAERSAIRISFDEWYISLFGADGQVGIDVECEDRLWAHLWALWPTWLEAGVDVVLDFGFWTRVDRDRARATARSAGADFEVIQVLTSDEVAIARCAERNRSGVGSFFIDRDTYQSLKQGFEPLHADEVRTTYWT